MLLLNGGVSEVSALVTVAVRWSFQMDDAWGGGRHRALFPETATLTFSLLPGTASSLGPALPRPLLDKDRIKVLFVLSWGPLRKPWVSLALTTLQYIFPVLAELFIYHRSENWLQADESPLWDHRGGLNYFGRGSIFVFVTPPASTIILQGIGLRVETRNHFWGH